MKGRAHAAIAGIAITSTNYVYALELLKRRFRDETIIKTALYQQLWDIPCAGSKLSELKSITEALDKIYDQLKTLGDFNQPSLMLLIKEKLPKGILIKLEEYRMASHDWNINVMREKNHELISIREVAYNESGCKPAKEKWQNYSTRQRLTNIHNSDLFTVSSSNIIDKKRRFLCAFCNRDHFHDECTQYRTILNCKKKNGRIESMQ